MLPPTSKSYSHSARFYRHPIVPYIYRSDPTPLLHLLYVKRCSHYRRCRCRPLQIITVAVTVGEMVLTLSPVIAVAVGVKRLTATTTATSTATNSKILNSLASSSSFNFIVVKFIVCNFIVVI